MRSPRKNSSLKIAIGCDIGGTSIKLARLKGNKVERTLEVPTPSTARAGHVLDAIARALTGLIDGRGPVPAGIAVPGFLDATRRRVVHLSNLPALNGVALAREIERRVPSLRVALDADTNAAAVAEARIGAGRGIERVLYVTMGTGLGAALVVEGQPVRVSRHTVGQVAHVPLDQAGPRCRCGERGCAETLLSARGILWRARRNGVHGAHSTEDLWRLARGRKKGARRVWREAGGALGRLLRILAGLFSPDVIVIGGGVAGAADLFLPAARRHLEKHLAPRLGGTVVVRAAKLGRLSGAVGAALLARERFSCHPS